MGDIWPTIEDWVRAGTALGLGTRALGKMVLGRDASGELAQMEVLAEEGRELLGYPNQDFSDVEDD